jgi:hypothetical protein
LFKEGCSSMLAGDARFAHLIHLSEFGKPAHHVVMDELA